MKVIAKDRGLGKTTELLKIAEENQYAFVCCNIHEVRRIERMNLNIPLLLTFQQLQAQRTRGLRINGIVIDNIDMCIPYTIWTDQWDESYTKTLIELSAKHWKYISVSSYVPNLAYSIASKATELGLDIPFPILHGERCRANTTLFHDPEEYLRSIANRPIDYVTVSRINTIDLLTNESKTHPPTPYR